MLLYIKNNRQTGAAGADDDHVVFVFDEVVGVTHAFRLQKLVREIAAKPGDGFESESRISDPGQKLFTTAQMTASTPTAQPTWETRTRNFWNASPGA